MGCVTHPGLVCSHGSMQKPGDTMVDISACIWLQVNMNASMDSWEQQLHAEYSFAPIAMISWGVLHLMGWYATMEACSSLETQWWISLSVFGSKWWWMHQWIAQSTSYTLHIHIIIILLHFFHHSWIQEEIQHSNDDPISLTRYYFYSLIVWLSELEVSPFFIWLLSRCKWIKMFLFSGPGVVVVVIHSLGLSRQLSPWLGQNFVTWLGQPGMWSLELWVSRRGKLKWVFTPKFGKILAKN